MEPVIVEYLDQYEEKLRQHLLKISTTRGELQGKLLESEDISQYWHDIEPAYVADAVRQIADYPTVSVAWASYLGMAVATLWDKDWTSARYKPYESYYGSKGFDDMDDHIMQEILCLPLSAPEAIKTTSLIQTLAQETISFIRHEQIEPQSPMAFYAFSRSCRAMYSIGAAIQLYRIGYKYEKV
ncbi:MAG: hypothetical protein IJ606_05450 [Bacteroidaceae bacterium]|nr:hypothetical protein [Bacteroidaceae bacterium]